MSMSDRPIDDVLDEGRSSSPTDPDEAYDGGWEAALEEGDGFEDYLLGEKPTTPEL